MRPLPKMEMVSSADDNCQDGDGVDDGDDGGDCGDYGDGDDALDSLLEMFCEGDDDHDDYDGDGKCTELRAGKDENRRASSIGKLCQENDHFCTPKNSNLKVNQQKLSSKLPCFF